MPSARSSDRARVGIAGILIVASAPRRIRPPWPKSRSIWVTAAASAASLALASLAEASFRAAFLSAISSTSLPPVCGQLDLRQRGVLRTLRLELRTVEGQSDAIEGLQQSLRQRPRKLREAGRPIRATFLAPHPGHGHVRPERALLRLVEPCRDQLLLQPRLQRDRIRRLGREREETRAAPLRAWCGIAQLDRGRGRSTHLDDVPQARDLLLRQLADEGEGDMERLGRDRSERRTGQRLTPPPGDPRPHPLGQVESDEQPHPRTPRSFLRHAADATRPRRTEQGANVKCARRLRYKGASSPPSRVRSRCIATRAERSRMSSRPPGMTGSRAIVAPSARRASKQT